MKPSIQQILADRILVLDGAMGTMIQQYKLNESDFRNQTLADHESPLQGNNDLLSLTRPDVVKAIHMAYLEAGADIIETNTFSSTSVAQADYHLEHLVSEMNYESARIASEATAEMTALNPEKPRFVAGAMGPTNRTASLSPDVNNPGFRAISFEELRKAYFQQAEGLVRGGADLLLVETVFDTLNAKAALMGVYDLFDQIGRTVPVMVSGTITDASGRTLSGQTTEAFLISVSHFPLLSVGLNCALGAELMMPYAQVLSAKAPFYTSVYPNAGLPNEMGEYDESAEMMAAQLKPFLELQLVNIVGGCCGTTPDHIAAMAQLAAQFKPRQVHNQTVEITA